MSSRRIPAAVYKVLRHWECDLHGMIFLCRHLSSCPQAQLGRVSSMLERRCTRILSVENRLLVSAFLLALWNDIQAMIVKIDQQRKSSPANRLHSAINKLISRDRHQIYGSAQHVCGHVEILGDVELQRVLEEPRYFGDNINALTETKILVRISQKTYLAPPIVRKLKVEKFPKALNSSLFTPQFRVNCFMASFSE